MIRARDTLQTISLPSATAAISSFPLTFPRDSANAIAAGIAAAIRIEATKIVRALLEWEDLKNNFTTDFVRTSREY